MNDDEYPQTNLTNCEILCHSLSFELLPQNTQFSEIFYVTYAARGPKKGGVTNDVISFISWKIIDFDANIALCKDCRRDFVINNCVQLHS